MMPWCIEVTDETMPGPEFRSAQLLSTRRRDRPILLVTRSTLFEEKMRLCESRDDTRTSR
jgi:hypothetical protein